MFVSRSPLFAPLCGLRLQLLYPYHNPADEDSDICNLHCALSTVGLSHLLDRVGGDWELDYDWELHLSGGEKQLIQLARILIRRPALVISDDAISDLDHMVCTSKLSQSKVNVVLI